MRIQPVWKNSSGTHPVWSLSASEDFVLIPQNCSVAVVDFQTGLLLRTLKGHSTVVVGVAQSVLGWFGSSDIGGTVIIWKQSGEGVLKYTHGSCVRGIFFFPDRELLLSGSQTDVGIWSSGKQAVEKVKVDSPVSCLGVWGPVHAIVGLHSGQIQLLDLSLVGAKLVSKQKLNGNVFQVSIKDNTLAVATWDKSGVSCFSLPDLACTAHLALPFQPLAVSFLTKSLFLTAGTSGQLTLCSREAMVAVISVEPVWVTSVVVCGGSDVVCATAAGSVSKSQIGFSTVHAIHKQTYAVRDNENPTQLLVQDLSKEIPNLRISCEQGLILKCALYGSKVAILFPGLTVALHSRIDGTRLSSFSIPADPSILLVAGINLIVCIGVTVESRSLTGEIVRQWLLPASIKYIKVVDGPIGQESIITGLQNGDVLILFLDKATPLKVIDHVSCIRWVDINSMKSLLAIIDDSSQLTIYKLQFPEKPIVVVKFQNATSASFNLAHPELLLWAGMNGLFIWHSQMPSICFPQPARGGIIGCNCSDAYLLNEGSTITDQLHYQFVIHALMRHGNTEAVPRLSALVSGKFS